jgi:membrane protein implicated in regulation of membrane protease activity
MSRPTLSLVFLIGAVGLMLLPLIVPVGFSGGHAGRSSLVPAWAVAVSFYAVLGTVALLSAREVVRERRRSGRS